MYIRDRIIVCLVDRSLVGGTPPQKKVEKVEKKKIFKLWKKN